MSSNSNLSALTNKQRTKYRNLCTLSSTKVAIRSLRCFVSTFRCTEGIWIWVTLVRRLSIYNKLRTLLESLKQARYSRLYKHQSYKTSPTLVISTDLSWWYHRRELMLSSLCSRWWSWRASNTFGSKSTLTISSSFRSRRTWFSGKQASSNPHQQRKNVLSTATRASRVLF